MSVVGEDDDRSPLDHPLATPPLRLDGLPSLGKPGIAAAVPVAVMCGRAIRRAPTCCGGRARGAAVPRRGPGGVGTVGSMSAATMPPSSTLLGDATLCAEAIGSNQGELTTSPGWSGSRRCTPRSPAPGARKVTAAQVIDDVSAKLDVDTRALSRVGPGGGATLTWIAEARRSGVAAQANAAVVIPAPDLHRAE